MCVVAGVVIINLSIIQTKTDETNRAQDVMTRVDDLAKSMIDLSAQVRGYLLTRDEAFAKGVTADHEEVQKGLDVLRGAVRSADQKARLEQISQAAEAYIADAGDPEIRLARDPATLGQALAIMTTGVNKRDMNAFKDAATRFNDAESQNLTQLLAVQSRAIATARWALLVGVALAIGLSSLLGLMLSRMIGEPLRRFAATMAEVGQGDFTKRVKHERRDEFGALADSFNRMVDEVAVLVGQVQGSGIQVNTSLTEIAATSRQQQATASEIAATTIQIGATSKEISATSRELVRTMGEVSTVAEQTAALAGAGQAGLAQMEETMHQVMQAAATINAKLAVLNDRAGNINQVVTTITKVADQTNLLSLNAAIEAEKAGEYGRGFAVVATEIRRLADQTAVATYDIEQMVKEIQTAISAGVMGMDKFSEEVRHGMQSVEQVGLQLSQIIQQVQALAPEFETVNGGMQAQATGAEQISQALLQLTEAAQQTVESLQQSSSAIDDISRVSGGLRSSVAKFKLEAA
jgi:methyl-accepting chemotaxis protein WspA